MQNININLNSIIFTFAPSGSGKSYFCKNVLISQIKKKYPLVKITYLSSDDIKRDIHGENVHKYSDKLDTVLVKAFTRLIKNVNEQCSVTNNSEIIIIDTLGFKKSFRDNLLEIALKNNYQTHALVFQYSLDEYYKYNDLTDLRYKEVINAHHQSFKANLETLRANEVSVIKSKDFSNIEITIDKYDNYASTIIDDIDNTPIVGDVHGCLDELKEVVRLNPNQKILLVGDFIDKGYAVKETIEYIFENQNLFKIVIGNHESFVYRKLKGLIGKTDHRDDKWFDSIKLLNSDDILKEKFITILDNICVPFIRNKEKTVYITHAPCEDKFIGKFDSKSLKAQRNFRFSRFADFNSYDEWINGITRDFLFLTKEASDDKPLHIFGHCATIDYVRYKNKICIDNGCVHGHGLTYLMIANANQINARTVVPHKVDLKNSKIINDAKCLDTVFYFEKENIEVIE